MGSLHPRTFDGLPSPLFCRFTVTGELRCSVNHITGTIPDQLGLLQDLGESIVARHWFVVVVVASRIDPNRSLLCSFIRSFVRSVVHLYGHSTPKV